MMRLAADEDSSGDEFFEAVEESLFDDEEPEQSSFTAASQAATPATQPHPPVEVPLPVEPHEVEAELVPFWV